MKKCGCEERAEDEIAGGVRLLGEAAMALWAGGQTRHVHVHVVGSPDQSRVRNCDVARGAKLTAICALYKRLTASSR